MTEATLNGASGGEPEASAPTTGGTPGQRSQLAEQLCEARVELRRDLDVSRHVFRGEVAYVLQDPLTFKSHRFSPRDYAILLSLHVDSTLAESFETLVASERLDRDDEERFYQFILSMHRGGFLKLPISDDETLYRRHLAKREQKRQGRAMSLLFLQVPLWNPDQFLVRTLRFVRPLFSRFAFGAWCALIALALWVLASNWSDFQRPVADIFSGGNLPLLWLTLIVLKVAHEFGHAYLCKYYGGYVPEMGLYLILFTPCAFVDASASWSFSRKRERFLVCMGGMYVEVAIAAIALLCWSVTPPGVLKLCLHNVVLLGSIVTIGFNVNPLMRYDGYYALSDLVEIPNLRARAQEYATALLKRLTLGVPIARSPKSAAERVGLCAFGIASALYKITLVIGISMAIAMKFFVAGLLLGAVYVGTEVVRLVRRTLPYLWSAEETHGVRVRARFYSLLLAVGLPLFVVAVPVPTRVTAPGVVVGGKQAVLRSEAAGFLRDVHVEPGERVVGGTLLFELDEPDKAANHAVTRSRLNAARVRQRVFELEDVGEARKESARIGQLEGELAYMQADLERLSVHAEPGGYVVDCLDPRERGRFVKRGEALATLVRGRPIVRVLLREEDVANARPEIGTEVEFRANDRPGTSFRGVVRLVRPTGTRKLDDAFMEHLDLTEFSLHPVTGEASRSQFELEVDLDPVAAVALRHGMTGRLRLEGGAETLGAVLYRKLVTFAGQL